MRQDFSSPRFTHGAIRHRRPVPNNQRANSIALAGLFEDTIFEEHYPTGLVEARRLAKQMISDDTG